MPVELADDTDAQNDFERLNEGRRYDQWISTRGDDRLKFVRVV